MTEYIEREAISEEIRKYYYKNPPNSSYGEGFDRGLDRAQRAILDAPAVNVAPVRHGKWTSIGYDCGENEYQCSECRRTEWRESADDMKFCMFCGAIMDGGADNG